MSSVLPWVRLDSRFPSNPKILELVSRPGGYKAAFAYTCGLSYCGEKGTYGAIPTAALPFIHATRKEARMLVAAGLWTEAEYGWDVHDWAAYQPDEEYVNKRKEKARNAARARWAKAKEDTPGSDAPSNAPSTAPRNAVSTN